jgi:hypothetical protein
MAKPRRTRWIPLVLLIPIAASQNLQPPDAVKFTVSSVKDLLSSLSERQPI